MQSDFNQDYRRAGDPPTHPASARAAFMVWFLGTVEVVLCGCGSLLLGIGSSSLTAEQLTTAFPQLSLAEVAPLRLFMWRMAIVMFLLGFLPGLLYLVAGFGVRRARALAINLAMLVAITQGIVLAPVTVVGIADAVLTGNPVVLTFRVIVMGSCLVLLGVTVRRLWLAWRTRGSAYEESPEPWNEPTP